MRRNSPAQSVRQFFRHPAAMPVVAALLVLLAVRALWVFCHRGALMEAPVTVRVTVYDTAQRRVRVLERLQYANDPVPMPEHCFAATILGASAETPIVSGSDAAALKAAGLRVGWLSRSKPGDPATGQVAAPDKPDAWFDEGTPAAGAITAAAYAGASPSLCLQCQAEGAEVLPPAEVRGVRELPNP